MTNNFCDACGRLRDCISISDAWICPICESDIRAEINRLAQLQNKKYPINVLALVKQYFLNHHDSGSYQLRSIPRELKLAVQHQALDEGLTLRELIFKALEEYLQKGG